MCSCFSSLLFSDERGREGGREEGKERERIKCWPANPSPCGLIHVHCIREEPLSICCQLHVHV